MAISPPGDIILEVARAADPEKVDAARARLQSLARTAAPAFDQAGFAGIRREPPARADMPEHFVQFEAMILQNFLETMLPKEGDAVFGKGLSGEMWRSVLAQQLGETMARRGGIGIADRVLGDHYLEDGKIMPVAGISGQEPEAATQAALSAALVEELERQATKTLAGDAKAPAKE